MSNDPSVPSSSAPVSAPKKRGIFAFLFKSVLGCSAFALGVLIALILLLPTLISGPAGSKIRTGFEDHFRGSLEVGDLTLGWFHPLEVRGVVLRDPDGKEVARVNAVLPSLFDLLSAGSAKIGRIALEVDADLVSDDQGITNLQRALEPRVKAPEPAVASTDKEPFDLFAWLSKLDLDLDVKSRKLSWSDADTRRVGTPFEVRDLVATVRARPSAPIQVHVGGRVVADQPGSLDIDATIRGPIDPKKAWPIGQVDAKGSIQGFSTAMVDDLARLNGGLRELFGARFALRFAASNVTSESGDLEFALDGEKASIAVSGRFVDGVLRSTEKPGVVASFPPPRRLFDVFARPHLPPGSKLTIDADARTWTVRVPRFALPLPPAGGAHDLAALRPTLEKAEIVLDVDVPCRIAFENEATRHMATPVAVSATHLGLTLAPNVPASVRLESALDTGVPGKLQIDVSLSDVWATLAAGAVPRGAGASPTPDTLQARISGVSTAALGALLGQRELVRDAIGPVVEASIDVRGASLDAGRLALTVKAEKLLLDAHAVLADGVVRCSGDDRITLTWRAEPDASKKLVQPFLPAGAELAPVAGPIVLEVRGLEVPLPDPKAADMLAALQKKAVLDLELKLPGASYADETLRTAKAAIALTDVDLTTKIAAGGATTAALRAGLDTGAPGKLSVDLATADVWRFSKPDALKNPPPVDVRVLVDGVSTATIDALAGQKGLIARALGDKLSLAIDAKNASLSSGALRIDVHTPNVALAFAGKLDGGQLRAGGEDDLHATIKIPADLVSGQLKPFLPADSAVTWPGNTGEIRLSVREIVVALPDLAVPNAKPFDLGATLDALAAKVHVEVPGVGWSDEHTRAAKLDVGARDLVLDTAITPKTPLVAKISAVLVPGKDARLTVDATLRDPFGTLKGAALSPVDAKIVVTGMDTNALDALAAQGGLLAGLLGPELGLTIDAKNAGVDSGTFRVDAKSKTTTFYAAGKLASNTIVCTGDEGVDLSIVLDPAFVEARTKSLLPEGTHVRLEDGTVPVTLKVRDVRLALPPRAPSVPASAGTGPAPQAKPDPDAALRALFEQVSKLALTVQATLPPLVYSDPATDAAKKPIALRNVSLDAHLAPTELPFARIAGRIVDDPPGEITGELRALDPLAKLAEANGRDAWRAKVVVRATKVPTAIVDMLAAQKGLLIEALGPRVEATVDAPEISLSKGAFTADLKSDLHSVHAEGHLDDHTLVIDKVDGLVAKVAVGPLLSEKVIGKLVPMLFDLQKPKGADPARFAVDAMRFPLDGDLSKLDAIVHVDLGEISYKLLPGLDSIVGNSLTASNVKLPPLTVPIKKGVASYDKLPIRMAGRDLLFSGTFSLVDQTFKLGTDVPLEILGKGINAELEGVRSVLDPKTSVPLEIRGTWKKPSISVGKEFVEKVIKGAAKKGLEGLLDGLGKKKKKD